MVEERPCAEVRRRDRTVIKRSSAALTWCSAAADYGRPLQHRVRPNSTRVRALDSFIVL